MIRNVTRSWASTPVAALTLAAIPACASAKGEVTDPTLSAMDVALTPVEDLNLHKDPIPATLVSAMESPYAAPEKLNCDGVREQIADLDAVLGEDYDTSGPEKKNKLSPGNVAKTVVSSLIPYRGVIRQLSGANHHEEQFKQAIAAGMMRRAYLKGLGQAMDCPYPARPATAEVIAYFERSQGDDDANTPAHSSPGEGTRMALAPTSEKVN